MKKLIEYLYKKYLKKPITIFLLIDFTLHIVKLTIKPIEQKHDQLIINANNQIKYIAFNSHNIQFILLL